MIENKYKIQTDGINYKIQKKIRCRFLWITWDKWIDIYAFKRVGVYIRTLTTSDKKEAIDKVIELNKVHEWADFEDAEPYDFEQ